MIRKLLVLVLTGTPQGRRLLRDFMEWSKQAEWRDGARKSAYIKSDWATYFKLFIEDEKRR